MKARLVSLATLPLIAVLGSGAAVAENIRIAVIDPASGPFAAVSANWFKSMQHAVDEVNRGKRAGDNTFELVAFDNKGNTQESLILLKTATDQGFRYVIQGGSSAVGAALIDAVNKHNERNAGKEVVLLNHSNADPELTNGKCSFWHFQFVSNSNMTTEALTTEIAKNQAVKKLFIIGQNYPFGQAVSAATKDYLKHKRPQIEIVGDDLHPIGQVKDFSPYIAKIKASGADAVVTGNWGPDLTLLLKAANDADLKVNFYTLFANTFGVPLAIEPGSAGRLKNIASYSPNNQGFVGKEYVETFKKKYNEDFILLPTYTVITMFADAVKKAGTTDPVKVAQALEGLKSETLSGTVEMRKADHQIQAPLFLTTWAKLDGQDVRYDQNDRGYGWKVEQRIEADVATQPTTCQMTRPN